MVWNIGYNVKCSCRSDKSQANSSSLSNMNVIALIRRHFLYLRPLSDDNVFLPGLFDMTHVSCVLVPSTVREATQTFFLSRQLRFRQNDGWQWSRYVNCPFESWHYIEIGGDYTFSKYIAALFRIQVMENRIYIFLYCNFKFMLTRSHFPWINECKRRCVALILQLECVGSR